MPADRRTTFYPKCRAILSTVFDGFGGADSAPTIIQVVPTEANVCLNGYKEADTWDLTFDAKALPFHPDLIRSMAVEIYIYDSGSTEADSSTVLDPLSTEAGANAFAIEENRLVAGLIDNAELVYSKEGRTFRLDGRDYTGLLTDRQWDPKTKVPHGRPLDVVVQELVDLGVGAVQKGGRTLTVKWVSSDAIPVVGATSTATKKKGRPVKAGANFWDVIYRTVLREGKIVFVRGTDVIISDPQTMTDQSAGKPALVAWGRNLSRIQAERKLGKEMTPQVEVISYDPITRDQISAKFPEKKDPTPTGIGTNKDETQQFVVRGVHDRTQLKKHAEMMYNNLARGESKVTFETRSLTDLGDTPFNLLTLRAGHPVVIGFDPFNVELLQSMRSYEQRFAYMRAERYTDAVADLVASSYELIDQFSKPMYTSEVQVGWTSREGVTLTVEALNFVSPDRDNHSAYETRVALEKLAATVGVGVQTLSDGITAGAQDAMDALKAAGW